MPDSQPVVLCGATEQIGAGVIAQLKPEYDVIHFILTSDAGATQIPALLRGEPTAADSTIGSGNYAKPPIAIIVGGGYDDAAIEKMMKAAAASGAKGVPWLRPDMTKPAPPLGPEYGKALVARIKELLPQLQSDGKMDDAAVQWY